MGMLTESKSIVEFPDYEADKCLIRAQCVPSANWKGNDRKCTWSVSKDEKTKILQVSYSVFLVKQFPQVP